MGVRKERKMKKRRRRKEPNNAPPPALQERHVCASKAPCVRLRAPDECQKVARRLRLEVPQERQTGELESAEEALGKRKKCAHFSK